jgi:hypothetical protein
MRMLFGLVAIGAAAACIMPSPVAGSSPFDFDGKWIGTLQTPDLGRCANRSSVVPVHAIHIENGRLRSYSFTTGNGPLPMTGGFLASGRFDARGYQPGKGTITFVGQVDETSLRGRWSAQAQPGDSCSGTFSFERD